MKITESLFNVNSCRYYGKKNIAEKPMRAKDVFLANISHQIRTPLNAIIRLSQVLIKRDLNQETCRWLIKYPLPLILVKRYQ